MEKPFATILPFWLPKVDNGVQDIFPIEHHLAIIIYLLNRNKEVDG